MKAFFHIYGLSLEVATKDSALLDIFLQELRTFRVKQHSTRNHAIRLTIRTLSASPEDTPLFTSFAPYQSMCMRDYRAPGTLVTRYGRSSIIVISRLHKREIQAAIAPEPAFLPDPAYFYCFTHPVSPWFKKRGMFFLHAGCVEHGSRGILILGPSRSGKSTFTLSAVRAGFKFIGDEQPLLSLQNGVFRVDAFPRRIRLDRTVARRFPELKTLRDSSTSDPLIFPLEQIWPNSSASSCEPRILVFPQFRPRGGFRVSRLEAVVVLARLLQDDHFVWYKNGPLNRISRQHLSLFEQLAQRVPSYSIQYGGRDILRIPSVFKRLLRDESSSQKS